jgi:hypothetical protein
VNHEGQHNEAIEALLAGGLEPAEARALEARLREAGSAHEAYSALCDLAGRLEALGDALRASMPEVTDLVAHVRLEADLLALGEAEARRAGEVDLVDEVLMAARLDDLGQTLREATPEIDFVDEVLMAAQLTDAAAQWRAEVPEVNLVDEVLIAKALLSAGDEARKNTPEVDLVGGVMREVRRTKARARVRVAPSRDELAARRARPASRSAAWLSLAAAACLLIGFGLIAFGVLVRPGSVQKSTLAGNTPGDTQREGSEPADSGNPESENGIAPVRVSPITVTNAALDGQGGDGLDGSNSAASEDAAFTVRDILLARANALAGTQGDRELLANWASLTAAQARALLEAGDLTREEALGLSLFLPAGEAIDVLLAQLGRNPDDPYLRLALAKNLEANDQHGAALTHLAALQRADAHNGLAAFMEAEMHLQAGNLSAAMAALERAGAHDMSYAYAGTTARARAAALQASGLGGHEAQLLAAITAGAVEYEQVRALADSMLQYGLYYEGIGDYDSAQAIYRSMENMGVQVASGAGYINEQIVGLEVQEDALQSQNGLATLLGQPETAQAITDSLRLLSMAWGGVEGYLADFNQVFTAAGLDIVNALAESVLNNGDFAAATQDLIVSALTN